MQKENDNANRVRVWLQKEFCVLRPKCAKNNMGKMDELENSNHYDKRKN